LYEFLNKKKNYLLLSVILNKKRIFASNPKIKKLHLFSYYLQKI
jgi:hypothetical protein